MAIVEHVVSLPILHPESGKKAHLRFMGKVDRVEGRTLIDWKGVASCSRFISQARIGYQGELYTMGLADVGIGIDEIEYRLITRPTIKLCGTDEKKAEETGVAIKMAYEQRCLDWLTEDPQKLTTYNYYIHSAKLEQAKWYLWESSRRLLENGRNTRWIPNTHACYAWERECAYLPLCDAVQNGADHEWLIDNQYRVLTSSHPELNGTDASTKIVTQSSLADLQLCEMYYYWKHKRRLKKGTEDHAEALWIGSAMHAGMERIDKGEDVALAAIESWAQANPVLGEKDNRKQDQQVARARAMVRVGLLKWENKANDE